VAAVDLAESLFGFKARVAFEKGLERTFSWYATSQSKAGVNPQR
jgi:hypothetical protein